MRAKESITRVLAVVFLAFALMLTACSGSSDQQAGGAGQAASGGESSEGGLRKEEFEDVVLVDNDAVTITLLSFYQKETNWAQSSGLVPMTTNEVAVKVKDKTDYGTSIRVEGYLDDEKLFIATSGDTTVDAGKSVNNSYTIGKDTQPDWTPLDSFDDLYNVTLSYTIMRLNENGVYPTEDNIEVEVNLGKVISGEVDAAEDAVLSKEDVVGTYLLDGSPEAVVAIYQLKDDGSFLMRIHAGDSSIERKGTFEVRDGKVYVNVPEGESGEINVMGTPTKVDVNAIVDAELVIDGDTLTTDDIGKNTVTAHRVSEDEYKKLVEKAASLAPKQVEVGEEVTADACTFTVNSFEFQDEVYPSDTSGYYTYWQDEPDASYLVADITYVNTGTDYHVPGYSTGALVYVGENKYQATVETDGGSRTSQSYSIDAKATGRVVIIASVPDAARDEGGDVKLYWVMPRDGSLLNTYFNSNNDNVTYIMAK